MSNPLFAVNRADMLLRHSEANHKRETIAFSKRRQGAAERLAVFAVWMNWVKKWRENDTAKETDGSTKNVRTAATVAGLADHRLGWKDVFAKRLFVKHQELPEVWSDYYWRKVKTLVMGSAQTEHVLKYAT